MGRSTVGTLLLWLFFVLSMRPDFRAKAKKEPPSEIEIEAKLKLLNKPALKTIKSEDGDIIDCVDIYKQPAFDHPALKNHTIKMIPDFFRESQNSSSKNGSQSKTFILQTWQKSGSCPKGTVPIRRILKEDLLRAASLDRFGRKPPAVFKNSTNSYNLNFPNFNATNKFIPENRSAAYLVTMGYNYIGAEADINTWTPKVDLPDDFTTAQIWLKANNGPVFESVEAGWTVNPKLYGDMATRLFAYWTRDSYESIGCFDLTCPGFVQVQRVLTLGTAITAISSKFGRQFDLNVGMFWDDAGNWWLRVNKDMPIGYWPAEILGNLKHSAILVEWGGQVFSTKLKKETPHTGTGMGSGDFANGLMGEACYMNNVRIKDYSLSLKYPEFVSAMADEPYCYNSLNDVKYGVEPTFYFGGPGRRPPYCP
ncbi:uncharacterized protein LOC113865947 [Abrus precatorius]|uniref:Uncharacterized protein LOC113865947 n=1 Tax=Abrus precatorius TaxID=3816 RepID=A0A8B8LJK4_ABRPR|nr:uncharacterized protein LOC113865947 [Abrus precatorius]